MTSKSSDRDIAPPTDDCPIFRGSVIELTAEESLAFAKALLNPREPTERLRAAVRRYREFIGG
jgi:uncharacterized protein (DUF1778 family)